MSMDKYDWHSGAENFPKDLPEEAGATHIGMFLAWAWLSGLKPSNEYKYDYEFDEYWKKQYKRFSKRSSTPGKILLEYFDGKLHHGDFNEEGEAFASYYYVGYEEGDYFKESGRSNYLEDYCDTFGAYDENIYYVPDNWSTYDKLKPILDQRLKEWRSLVQQEVDLIKNDN